jgi:predicted Zn-dependent protease
LKHQERAREIFAAAARAGLQEAELYLKAGWSRRLQVDLQGTTSSSSQEQGWAIRAGGSRASLFAAGTGLPPADLAWPEPDGQPLHLPSAAVVPDWNPSPDLELPFLTESETVGILEGIERALTAALPDSRVLGGTLEEGTSETSIFNTQAVETHFRRRAASLFVEAVGPWPGSRSGRLSLAERDPRRFQPVAIADRLANRLLLAREGAAPTRARGEILLSSVVAARVLLALSPMLVGRGGESIARRIRDRRGKVASELLSVIDDGRFPGGVLAAPVDGEGQPTGPSLLIEEGRFCRALTDWRQATGSAGKPRGCMRREGWRDLPQVGPSHLYIRPQPGVSVGDLLGSIARGYYLVESLGAGSFDFERDRFRLPVCGFALQQGAATEPLSQVWLEGGIKALLDGIQGVARDLTFEPLGAMIGAPSLLIGGFGLRGSDSG